MHHISVMLKYVNHTIIFLHRKEQQITDNNCVIIIRAQITLFLLRGISESLCDRKFNVTRREENRI